MKNRITVSYCILPNQTIYKVLYRDKDIAQTALRQLSHKLSSNKPIHRDQCLIKIYISLWEIMQDQKSFP